MTLKLKRNVLILITGPVRSGKSRYAELRARRTRGQVTYIATAPRIEGDAEWSERLAHHLERRPPSWKTVETAGLEASAIEALLRTAPVGTTLIFDSLGTWLADQMHRLQVDIHLELMPRLELLAECLADACIASRARVIVVGEEVGWSIVPETAQGRIFRDVLGRLQQRLARASRSFYLIVAGYALDMKVTGTPIAPRRRGQPL